MRDHCLLAAGLLAACTLPFRPNQYGAHSGGDNSETFSPGLPSQERSRDFITPLGTPGCCFLNLGILWLCPSPASSIPLPSPPPAPPTLILKVFIKIYCEITCFMVINLRIEGNWEPDVSSLFTEYPDILGVNRNLVTLLTFCDLPFLQRNGNSPTMRVVSCHQVPLLLFGGLWNFQKLR